MSSEITLDSSALAEALASAGLHPQLRADVFDALRRAQADFDDPTTFRESVRWPIVLALLQGARTHQVELADGLVFEVTPDSRIERALLLSPDARPDHVWEPQTTRLLVALARQSTNVVVGGAYIGDQALPMARAVPPGGRVHAFEPMSQAFERLLRNIALNSIDNVVPQRLSLWDASDVTLRLSGDLALASSVAVDGGRDGDAEAVMSMTITDYKRRFELRSVDLISLDTEGGEEKALAGAAELLELPAGEAPNIVFEIHRNFVDWTDGLENTSVARFLLSRGYHLFAIRDFHDNHPMAGEPIEVIPVDRVYLEGPPHGFNVLAIKDPALADRLGLEVVEDVSPKLLLEKDPALHRPLHRLHRA